MIYTRTQLLSDINTGIHGKIGMLLSRGDFANAVARAVASTLNLRSMRRRAALTPKLFSGIYEYAAPSDLKANGIIDIPAQAKRYDGSFTLIPSEQFAVSKQLGDIALDDYNGIRTLLINSEIVDTQQQVSTLESTTASGTWVLFGDATNVRDDSDDYVNGAGSIAYDISAAAGTTAGIQTSDLDSFDITDFLGGNSAVFVWAKFNNVTNLTNMILRLGSDSSNYYSKTITTRHDGTALVAGWNLLRFDLTSLTETGSVTDTAITYSAIYMTKTAAKVSETDYKFNWMVIKLGQIHNVLYQSAYPWQSSAGTYLQNSTDESDLLNADQQEYNLFVTQGIALGRRYTGFSNVEIQQADKDFTDAVAVYKMENPDETKTMVSSYYNY